jgi:hypothetical protein
MAKICSTIEIFSIVVTQKALKDETNIIHVIWNLTRFVQTWDPVAAVQGFLWKAGIPISDLQVSPLGGK